jgi:hypothetical protein
LPYTGWQAPSRFTLDPKSSEESSAPRRCLAAGGATQQLLAVQPGSLARWQAVSTPSRHGCRAPRVPPPTANDSQFQRCRGAMRPRPDAAVPWSPCPRPRLHQRPHVQRRPVQCPASGTCPASARLVSDVRCPVPGVRVRCPVRASGILVHVVRADESVEHVGAAAATRPGAGRDG